MTLAPLPQPSHILSIRDERARAALVATLRSALTEAVTGLAQRAATRRPVVRGRPSAAALAIEAETLAGAAATLRRLAGVLTDAAKLAEEYLADAVRDHLGDDRRSAHIPVSDGAQVDVTMTTPTRTVAEIDEVADVLAAWATVDQPTHAVPAARAARDAISRLLSLARPAWRTTDARRLAGELATAGEPALAARMEGAIVRSPDSRRCETVAVKITSTEAA